MSEYSRAVISVGSNIERERYLPEAIRALRRCERVDVERVSRFYESAVEFRVASRLRPRAPEPVINLGRLYERVGWHAEASVAS